MESYLYDQTVYIQTHRGNFPQALTDLFMGIDIIQNPEMDKDPDDNEVNWYFKYFGTKKTADIRLGELGWLHLHLGHLYGSVGNYAE